MRLSVSRRRERRKRRCRQENLAPTRYERGDGALPSEHNVEPASPTLKGSYGSENHSKKEEEWGRKPTRSTTPTSSDPTQKSEQPSYPESVTTSVFTAENDGANMPCLLPYDALRKELHKRTTGSENSRSRIPNNTKPFLTGCDRCQRGCSFVRSRGRHHNTCCCCVVLLRHRT